jgi:membrane protease YdiL (CAAX protease family)
MDQRHPVSFPKVTSLIAGLFMRRFVNRLTAGLLRKKEAPDSRAGTGRKSVGSPLGLVAIVAIFIFNTVNISAEAVKTLASELGPTHDAAGRVEIGQSTYNLLSLYETQLFQTFLPESHAPSFASRVENARNLAQWYEQKGMDGFVPLTQPTARQLSGLRFTSTRDNAGHIEISPLTYGKLHAYSSHPYQIFLPESEAANLNSQADYAHILVQWYEQKGLAGFVPIPQPPQTPYRWFPTVRAWHDPVLRPLLIHALGLILLILAGARHCWTLGSRNQDLGQVEWATEWLFTLPASSPSLFGAQILGHALVDPFAWIGAIPFLVVIYLSTGAGWAIALPAALFNSLYLSLVMSSLRVVSETWLRKTLSPARLKNLQALFTLVGIVLLFLLFALARSQVVTQWVVRLASRSSPLLLWNPFSIPAAAFLLPRAIVPTWEMLCATAIVIGAIVFCSFLVRDGLVSAPAIYSGDRGPASGRDFLPSGIIGKDLRLLLRDRNFFVQTLVAPALIVCFQVLFNVGMARSIGSNFHNAATFAFAVGAYVMISTGLNVLAVEGNSLWMLYGLPVALPSIMLRKTMLWSALGVCYATAVLAICAWHIRSFQSVDLSDTALALAGVVIYSFIAAGMGMLATDPLEVEVKRRIRPGMIYLYMILATLYGYALYASSTWVRLGQIVLSTLLAYALWQKVRDRSPFLLDAVSMPPARVSLADGLMAALGFFILQGALTIFFLNLHILVSEAIVLAFASAGALVVGFTLFSFWRAHVAGVFSAIGLPGPRDGRRVPAILIGVAFGLAAFAVSLGYLRVLSFFPLLDSLQHAEELAMVRGWWLVSLAVLAAPLFEEFIFRGLVFRGMRRSLPAGWSIAGSAAVFAICHPPISVIPVFFMGVLAALGFELTGWIVTPICVHMIYNGLVLLASLLPHGSHL